MAEKLTKKAIKAELDRRIKWYEDSFGFEPGVDVKPDMRFLYGRYMALVDMKWQIKNGSFIWGFAS